MVSHVQRRAINVPMRTTKLIQIEETKKGKGKPSRNSIKIKNKNKKTHQLRR